MIQPEFVKSPNILVFVSHDTGRWLSPYGAATVHTPAFERFASESVMFSEAFCVSPLCSPSRASLFTSRYPHEVGVMGLVDPQFGWDLNPKSEHLASILSNFGYECCLCGFLHEVLDCRKLPFDSIIAGPGEGTNRGRSVMEHAGEIDRWLDSREDGQRPFYLQVGCPETHRDFDRFDAQADDSKGIEVPEHLHDTDEIRRDMAQFQGSVKQLDSGFGAIVEVLRQRELLEDTIIIATTDHGVDYPRMKGTFSDDGLESFLFMRYPNGGWLPGTVVDRPVSHLDILPTLLDQVGIEPASVCRGRSLLPLLRGECFAWEDSDLFSQKTYHDSYDPTRAVRSCRYKYVRYFEKSVLDDMRLDTVLRSSWVRESLVRTDDELLFDLENDPREVANLASEPEHREALLEMRRRLADQMLETRDPLLQGPIASPVYYKAVNEIQASRSHHDTVA
ncbi:sulfatase [Pelagicoccus enzymogenes]|uniref:sulfatase family protein n=1 Tax=Pelagicoccus enzymogenes TaxID=2773457 RepID=UPI0028106B56|nr:sulfatase [Pelagicoccus enzymogenes]MDQ8199437.1 sulfatase [Pelagicoccus enzymogenes]